ncbi:MAG: VWA-like domain-containing protein [Lachnospiraceae bacterium]|nr:VWA-like domain-containing protein [Lachnospiraceae bacterium]
METNEYALKVLSLARDTITVRYRFFDRALMHLKAKESEIPGVYSADGEYLYYHPLTLLNDYLKEPAFAVRLYLHLLFHYIFLHPVRFDKQNENYWNIATDIAVENIILEMNIPGTELSGDDEKRLIISRLRKWTPNITAEKLYREFAAQGISSEAEKEYKRLFTMDRHRDRAVYKDDPVTNLTREDWEKISERVKAELKSFSKNSKGSDEILGNISEATRKRVNYEALLRKFAVQSETIKINPDEFDYIYYTYGLKLYDNMPLIEPLEYAEDKKIKEFVIAIDTSASCRGELVKKFLERTVSILKDSDSFHKEVNIRVVLCDSAVTSVTTIKNIEDLVKLTDNFKLSGFGATDFRPVFDYVSECVAKKEFENLKGIIYFTDGYGIYPEKAPEFDTVFAFAGADDMRPPIPAWAIKCEIDEE